MDEQSRSDLSVPQGNSSAVGGVRDGDLPALLARVEAAEGPELEYIA